MRTPRLLVQDVEECDPFLDITVPNSLDSLLLVQDGEVVHIRHRSTGNNWLRFALDYFISQLETKWPKEIATAGLNIEHIRKLNI